MSPQEGFLRRLDEALTAREDRYDELLHRALGGCRSVLDVGCGNEGVLLRRVPGIPHAVGVDLALPTAGSPSELHSEYVRLDIRQLAERFEPGTFDAVVALDVVEHLSKAEGMVLLESIERIAARRVVVFTPNGFLSQPPSPVNPHQEHRSGWKAADFADRGYRIRGVNGWRPLRGEYAELRGPSRNWWRLSLLSFPLTERNPRFAFQLLCVKDLDCSLA